MIQNAKTQSRTVPLIRLPEWAARAVGVLGSVLLLSLLAQVSIQTPFSPVPVTLQTFAVALIGLSVRKLWDRVGAVVAYILLGFAGAPVFAGGAAGIQLGASLGYLLAMVLSVAVIGDIAQSRVGQTVWGRVAAVYAGSAVTFIGGTLWISFLYPELSLIQVLQIGVLPFILGDFLKNMTAVSLNAALGAVTNRNLKP